MIIIADLSSCFVCQHCLPLNNELKRADIAVAAIKFCAVSFTRVMIFRLWTVVVSVKLLMAGSAAAFAA